MVEKLDIKAPVIERIDSYKDLIVWQKSLILIKLVYKATESFPRDEIWALTSQIKRSSISVASNIAEGSAKRSTREFIRFLNISYGSLAELEAQLLISVELKFISQENVKPLIDLANEIGRMINGLIRSLTNKLNSEL